MNNKSSYIVIISEGEETERKIINNLNRVFPDFNNKIIFLSYKTNIYQLFEEVNKDEYIDLIGLLKEKEIKAKIIGENVIGNTFLDINTDEVSQIYLFFDYDAHDNFSSNEKIVEMLKLFCEETDKGKLYISYPMAEALRHLKRHKIEIEDYIVEIEKGSSYKKTSSENSDFEHFGQYNFDDWLFISKENLDRCNFLFETEIINYDIYNNVINQQSIFDKQLKKYISTEKKVLVLSSFPFFLIEYFGNNFFTKILTNKL